MPGLTWPGFIPVPEENGEARDVTSQDVNEYLRQIAGEDFTAKDFRTWGGTVLAAIALSKQEEFETKKQAKSNIKTAICAVAELLGNTPAVCRKCYVHPVIVEAYLKRTPIAGLNGNTKSLDASQSPRSGTSSSKVPPRALNVEAYKRAIAFPSRCSTWSMVHWRGSLSGRQRRNLVPCRKRPPVK